MIFALAGRRIDKAGARRARFPLTMRNVVRDRIRECLRDGGASALISSAACGADLLAQDAASELSIARHIILPFERRRFRITSVTDRPGDWGAMFDRLCDEVESEGNLKVLELGSDERPAYASTTTEILNRAPMIERAIKAVIVWDGNSWGADDQSAAFKSEASRRRIDVVEISTIR